MVALALVGTPPTEDSGQAAEDREFDHFTDFVSKKRRVFAKGTSFLPVKSAISLEGDKLNPKGTSFHWGCLWE
jgi:hypothetical protein